jgi:hypothetical protein
VTHAFLAHPPPRVFKRNQLIPAAWGDTPYGFFAAWFACAGPLNHGKVSAIGESTATSAEHDWPSRACRATAAVRARIDREVPRGPLRAAFRGWKYAELEFLAASCSIE